MVATPRLASDGNDDPPMAISAGNGPLPLGLLMVAVNDTVFVPFPTVTMRFAPLSVPVTELGLAGLAPSSYCCACAMISARRHVQSALLAMRVPLIDLKGSGIF